MSLGRWAPRRAPPRLRAHALSSAQAGRGARGAARRHRNGQAEQRCSARRAHRSTRAAAGGHMLAPPAPLQATLAAVITACSTAAHAAVRWRDCQCARARVRVPAKATPAAATDPACDPLSAPPTPCCWRAAAQVCARRRATLASPSATRAYGDGPGDSELTAGGVQVASGGGFCREETTRAVILPSSGLVPWDLAVAHHGQAGPHRAPV